MPIVQPRRVQFLSPLFRLLVLSFISLLASCQSLPHGKDKADGNETAEGSPTQLPIGTVHMVDPDGKFVLIQSSRFLPVEAETPVTTVSSNGLETAQLKVSPARKGQFITADIMSGRPGIGDRAVMIYAPPAAEGTGRPSASGSGTDSEIQILE